MGTRGYKEEVTVGPLYPYNCANSYTDPMVGQLNVREKVSEILSTHVESTAVELVDR